MVLTLAFLIHVKDIFTRAFVHREKGIFWGATSMVANWKDVKDLFGHLRWFVGLGPKPQFERYAYWEKFDYWAVFWGMIVIGFSGYAMWFAPFFARFLPGWALNAVLVIHSEEGLLAILFIFSIHFVNTHLRPDSFPMDMVIFTGVESEEEFKHKRPLEYERLKAQGKLEARIGRSAGDLADQFLQGGWIHGHSDRPGASGADVERIFQRVTRQNAMSLARAKAVRQRDQRARQRSYLSLRLDFVLSLLALGACAARAEHKPKDKDCLACHSDCHFDHGGQRQASQPVCG